MTFYQDASGEWRWTMRADNGEIVGASSEGFYDEHNARENAKTLSKLLAKWAAIRGAT